MFNKSNCSCPNLSEFNKQISKFELEITEMAEAAKRLLKTASDPFSAVIKVLHERPENVSTAGVSVKQALLNAFETQEQIPGIVKLLSEHIKEVVRQSNIIAVHNEHLSQANWAGYLIKLKEQIKFEITKEQGLLVLKNIAGLTCIEHGLELPLEKILVKPPKLEITVKLGLLTPTKVVDIV